jgi:hypothetical protein
MNQTDYAAIQKQFLQKIEDLISKETSLVFELSELLGISTDSVYRRMRAETMMTLDEIIKVCNHYNVSFDAFSKTESGMVTFRYSVPEPTFESFLNYQLKIRDDMRKILASESGKIIYAAEDIPVFFHYGFDEISRFKIFYWLKSVASVPELQTVQYNPNLISNEILDVSKEIFDMYMNIPSVEIWTEMTVVSAVKQIEYFWESGFFAGPEDALRVCESLTEELTVILGMAEKSAKNGKEKENYRLYCSDIEIANNCVLVELGNHRAVYLGHLTFYTLSTSSETYGEKTAGWLDTLIRKSTLISGVSEKQRLRFFKKAMDTVGELKKKIGGI